MRIRQQKQFGYGYTSIAEINGKLPDMLMDFGILTLDAGQELTDRRNKERAFLLIRGGVEFEWGSDKAVAERDSCFNEAPWCLHVPSGVSVKIRGTMPHTELSIHRTNNDRLFPSILFKPEDCRINQVGAGSMKEMATRTVRTIIDKSNREKSNLVLGETINLPGRWSGYPPHYHPQPELYFYKFNPEDGFGYAQLGDEVYKVRNNDTMLIRGGITHPQVSAPGYAMYYLWAIRHLEDMPYINPTFLPDYLWVTNKDIPIWPDK